jgi:23S rRNA (cytosine1962-C5)-methyltransferase
MQLPIIYLKPGKEQSLKRFHPWIFSGAIKNVGGEVTEGDLVRIHDAHDNFLAIGHYQIGSIAVRVLTFQDEVVDHAFWVKRISVAWELRKTLGLAGSDTTNAYRLIHGEGDGMPGLIVDMYATTAVMQMHTVAMYLMRDSLVKAFQEVLGQQLEAIYEKSEGTLPFKADV